MKSNTTSGTSSPKNPAAGGSIQNPLAGQLFRAENGEFREIVNRAEDQIFYRTIRDEKEKVYSTSEWFAWCTWNNVKPANSTEVALYFSGNTKEEDLLKH